mmetsp:Transcript_13734/g.18790  ORF Transcript_13734/g.18790 Transcript_13734/m.18790 type:complete len:208 (-) Transcript_13734:463-1086(-)
MLALPSRADANQTVPHDDEVHGDVQDQMRHHHDLEEVKGVLREVVQDHPRGVVPERQVSHEPHDTAHDGAGQDSPSSDTPPSVQVAAGLLGGDVCLEVRGSTREREDDGASGLQHASEAEDFVVIRSVVQLMLDRSANDHQHQHCHNSSDGEQAEIGEVSEGAEHAHRHDEHAHRHDRGEGLVTNDGFTTPRPQQIRESGTDDKNVP